MALQLSSLNSGMGQRNYANKFLQDDDELKEAVKAIRGLLEYGEIQSLAKSHGVDTRRAYALLQGRLKILDSDEGFVMACFDRAIRRKNRNDKLASLLK